MQLPTTRSEFRQYCLRAIGGEVVNINISPNQIEDRIDEALSFYRDYHYGGRKEVTLAITLTQEHLDTKSIPMPPSTASIVSIYKSSFTATGIGGSDILSVQRRITLEDVVMAGRGSLTSYYIIRQNLQTLDHLMTPMVRFRYNTNDNVLYLDTNWATLKVGTVIFVETFQNIDPEEDPKTWSDRTFIALATAYLKRQWGENLTKFTGIQLAGGVQLNGDQILSDARAEIEKLETDFIMKYQIPDDFYTN